MMIKNSPFVTLSLIFLIIFFIFYPEIAKSNHNSETIQNAIKSASELDYPPFSIVQSDGTADGFSVEILKATVAAIGKDISFFVGPWHEIKRQLIEGHLDVLPLVSHSDERDKVLDFSTPYLRMHGTIFVRKDDHRINTEADLADKEVVVMRGDTAHEYAISKNLSDKLILKDSFEEAMKDLSNGKHDALIVQQLVGYQLIKKLKISNIVDLGSFKETNLKPEKIPLSGFEQKFCFAVPEGDKELLSLLNEGLSLIIADGTFDEIYHKWFGPILPQASVSLVTIVKYLMLCLLPILFFIAIFGIWYLKKEVIKKTKYLKDEIKNKVLAQKALQESEEKFKGMFERAPLSYQSLDENGNFVEVNKTWLKTMGYARDEVLGKNFSEFLVPEWKTHFQENFPRFKAVGEILGVEFEMVKKDGSVILVSFHGKIGKNEKGNFQQTHCIFQDITTNKMIQKESERNKTILMESEKLAGFGGWQWDIEKDTWTMSRNWLNIHGCTNPNIVTDKLIEIAHPDDRLKIQTAFNTILNDGGKYDVEHRIVHQKTGEIKYIHAYGETRSDVTGKIAQVFGAAQDITERKQAEESSKRLKERLESLWNVAKIADSDIQTISDHVLEEVLKMTQSQYAFYGFLDKNEKEMALHAWSHETMNDCKTNEKTLHFAIDKAGIWAEAIKEKKVLTINDFHLDHPGKKGIPDGHVQLNRLMAVPYIKGDKVISIVAVANKAAEYSKEDEKQVQAFMGSVQLLLDRKTAEQEKIDLLTRLQQLQKIESIGNLAGGIAHDFNNLLFPIIGMAEMLLEDLPSNSLEYENAQEIYDAGKRAGDLVQQILAFSRQSEHKMVPVRVQNILKEVLKLSRSTIPTDIDIHQDIQTDCGAVRADATQIHQVVMNLITNAYHAVQENPGTISVRLKEIRLDNRAVPDVTLKQGKYVMLSVSDTGVGIEPNVVKKIFEPYFTTKKQGKGTGLGLAVVFGIIKEHQGDIKVYSEIGKGTTFNVYLPLIQKSTKTLPADQAQKTETGTERVLLVDDEISIAKLESQILSRLGYRVTEQTSSLDALKLFKANPENFDVVITDMTMPNMTGDQFAREMLLIRPDIPIIICTGFSERVDKEHAESVGAKGFLMKPVVKSDLAQMVRKVLDKSKIL